MKKIMITTLVAGLVASVATAEVTTTLDFANAYVFRGVTANGGTVFQPGIEVSGFGLAEEYGSLSAGAWANYDFEDYGKGSDMKVGSYSEETDWFATYGLPTLVDGPDLFIGFREYTYGVGSSDKEVQAGAGYEIAGIALGLTYYQGVGGGMDTQVYIEGAASYALEPCSAMSASIDATAAYMDPSEGNGKSGFHNYTVGGSLSYTPERKVECWSITYVYRPGR